LEIDASGSVSFNTGRTKMAAAFRIAVLPDADLDAGECVPVGTDI
jgi:hypothetical protein